MSPWRSVAAFMFRFAEDGVSLRSACAGVVGSANFMRRLTLRQTPMLMRSRHVEQEVLDLLDEPAPR